jgi:aldose 1-epimerase
MPDGSKNRLLTFLVVTATTLLLWGVGCKMKRVHEEKAPEPAKPLEIGGQEPYTASRLQEGTGGSREFLSVTMLPGRGMDVYQITAYIPGIGVTNLLASPPLEDTAKRMTDRGEDANGAEDTQAGGAFLVPFAGAMHETQSGNNVMASWSGKSISLPSGPVDAGMQPAALNGLLLDRAIDGQIDDQPLLDGHELNAEIHGGDFSQHWPSETDVTFKILLSPRSVDVAVTLQNTGPEAEPVSVGWRPFFSIPSGQRAQARLHIPAAQRIEFSDAKNRIPTGRTVPVAGTAYDFSSHSGVALGTLGLNDDFVSLKSTVFDSGPTIELMDPAASYGLRMICRSDRIKDLHVYAPVGKNFVVIQPQFNYPDPMSKVWKSDNNGMVVLQPGEQVKWNVRLEFYIPVSKSDAESY